MEAGELAGWVHSVIKPMVSEVIVSHPRSLAWIGKDSIKYDKIDARNLAELMRLGRVHEVAARHHAELAAQQAETASIAKANADAQTCYNGDKFRCN